MYPVDIAGSRVRLRELSAADSAALTAIIADPRVFATLGDEIPPTEEQIREGLVLRAEAAQAAERMRYDLGIEANGALVGLCALSNMDIRNSAAELSYFVDATQWGKGYASEAARLITELGLSSLGLYRIWATTDPTNIGSQRVMLNAGMSQEGHLRGYKLVRGQRRDSLLFARLASDPS